MIHMASVRYLKDWLSADVGEGVMRVNSYIAGVPRFAGDNQPDPFQIVTDIYRAGNRDSMRAAQAAEWPAKYPALYVTPSGSVPMEGEVGVSTRDALLTVALSITLRMSDFALAAQWAAYYVKVLERAMVPFFADDDIGRTARGEGNDSGIMILGCNGDPKQKNTGREYAMVTGPWDERIGDNISEQPLFLNLQVRDFTP